MPAKKPAPKKKAKKGGAGSNIFDLFTQKQVAEFKEGFQVMDKDKDGVVNKEDLKTTFSEMGRAATEEDFDSMIADSPNPINFTTLLSMFASRSSGEQDDDDVIISAFKSFEAKPGQIDPKEFRSMLKAFGDKFTDAEVDDVFSIMDMESGTINSGALISLLVAKKGEEEVEETA
ncbi:unnamed protein product [Meganyctiphanes norvegica]|uniref:EF-hand domain-containing protein n=1 Tax=Meganyctiphanes norvegica TaxID=48144 RepID=A0AAV2SMB9_MEGNR